MNLPVPLCNSLIILGTCIFSWLGFRSRAVEEKYIFHPESILAGKEYYRLVTCAFLHSGWQHLVLNMLSLYFFGPVIELWLGKAQFLLIYFGSIIGGSLLSLYVHRHHEYLAYGASGGVCGVIFAHILLVPGSSIFMYFIPIGIPGWLYAIGFMLGAFFAMKADRDNVGHDAHLGGAIVGLLIAAALEPEAVRNNWRVFGIVLGLSAGLLAYLWVNPLFLPMPVFFQAARKSKRHRAKLPRHKQEELELDTVLEKVSRGGMESLSPQEKAFLQGVSGKYQRRADSKKPESDLII